MTPELSFGRSSIGSLLPASGTAAHRSTEKMSSAAQQFEALLLTEMMKSARQSGSGDWMGAAEDQSGVSVSEMAGEQFAQALASSGGIGIARLVLGGLSSPNTPKGIDEDKSHPASAGATEPNAPAAPARVGAQ